MVSNLILLIKLLVLKIILNLHLLIFPLIPIQLLSQGNYENFYLTQLFKSQIIILSFHLPKICCDIKKVVQFSSFLKLFGLIEVVNSYQRLIYHDLHKNEKYTNQNVYKFSDLVSTIYNQWFIIYDPEHVDTSSTILDSGIYGLFKFNSGIYKYYYSNFYANYLIGLKISIVTYNDIPIYCGLSIMITEAFKLYISLFMMNNLIHFEYQLKQFTNLDESDIQTHNLIIYTTSSTPSSLTYNSIQQLSLITYIEIPNFPFLYSVKGNYTDDTVGWGLQLVYVTPGYCPQFCQLFEFKICQSGYLKYKDNTYISRCDQPYQKLNGSYCQDFYDETPYSNYLTYDFLNNTVDHQYYGCINQPIKMGRILSKAQIYLILIIIQIELKSRIYIIHISIIQEYLEEENMIKYIKGQIMT